MHKLALLWAAHNEEERLKRKKRNISQRFLDRLSEMPNDLFVERFRLDKLTFRKLCRDLREHTSLRGTKEIPMQLKVLCALGFLATGSYQRIVGITHHLTLGMANRCIKQVIEALNTDYMLRYIEFPPTQEERAKITEEFVTRFNVPGVIGCIDCTHIAIAKPTQDDHLFLNSEGYHSLNVQMICDHNLKILDVDSKFGGATQDHFIWESSLVEPFLKELHECGEQLCLLGDSEYPQRAWLRTPKLHATPGSREEVYSSRDMIARNCIDSCFKLLKSRWRFLVKHKSLYYHPRIASRIVSACCVLHNIALEAGLPPPVEVPEQHDDVVDNV